MRKSIAEASEFRHILPDAVPGGGEGVHESRAGHVDEVFARKRSKYAVGTGAAPPSRRVFPKRHTIDVSNTESPYFYYILSGTVRLAYVGANGEERTILYAGAGTLMNVPTIIAGDIKNTVVTCTERVEAAIFDAGLLTDRAFAAARPDLLLNLIHSLCRMGLPRHERHHQQRREGHQRPRPALYGQVPPLDGNRPALPAHPGNSPRGTGHPSCWTSPPCWSCSPSS